MKQLNPLYIVALFPIAVIVVYIAARAIFLAYFKSKRDFIKEVKDETKNSETE